MKMRSMTSEITTLRRTLNQLELIDKNDLKKQESSRSWKRYKVSHQLYFIATHQFRKPILYQFCKEHNLKVSGTKFVLVVQIWEAGFEFSDVNAFALRCKVQAESLAPKMKVVERIQLANLKAINKHSRKQNADGIEVVGLNHGDPVDHTEQNNFY